VALRDFGILFVEAVTEPHDLFAKSVGKLFAINPMHELRGIVSVV
jgi:hypothetical protein